jgi:hypothetical protein
MIPGRRIRRQSEDIRVSVMYVSCVTGLCIETKLNPRNWILIWLCRCSAVGQGTWDETRQEVDKNVLFGSVVIDRLASVLPVQLKGDLRKVMFFWSEVKWSYVKWCCFEVKWSGVTVKFLGTKNAVYIMVTVLFSTFFQYSFGFNLYHCIYSCVFFLCFCLTV